MKLITEIHEQEEVEFISEERSDGSGEKDWYIKGIFMQAEMKNRNGRMYPASILESEVNRYNREYVEKNRAYGELGHPNGPTINLDKVSHMIKELKQDGNNYIGKAKIMDTPNGNIVKNLMKEGASLGVSSRGMGTLKEKRGVNEVQKDFILATPADIVADPSAPEAFVEGIMEGVDWVLENGKWVPMIERAQEQIKRANRKELEETKLMVFRDFLKNL